MPFFIESLTLNKCLPGGLQQSFRRAAPNIHEALPDDGTEPAALCFCKYDVRVMSGSNRQDSGGPTANQLCQSELRGSLQRPFVMSRIERPDSLLQPVEQGGA